MSTNKEIVNAKVESVFVGLEDHGVPCWNIAFAGAAWGQGTGTRSLQGFDVKLKDLCRLFETSNFQAFVGKPCRLERQNGMITAIGHYIEDTWVKI